MTEEPKYTESDMRVLTEAALRLGRKEAGEQISAYLLTTAENDDEQMGRIALRFAARSAREIGLQPSPDATSGRTEAPGHSDLT